METKRKFILGDEWLYLKIYSGPKYLEQILVQELRDLMNEFIQKGWTSYFFFVRYTDPDDHIRLRIYLKDGQHLSLIINNLNGILSEKVIDRSIYKVSFDTYNREMERYGNAIEIAEQLFYVDSVSTIHFLSKTNLSDKHRWLYSMVWIDKFIDNFLLSDGEKDEFYQNMYDAYKSELGIQKEAKIVMDMKYRRLNRKMDEVYSDRTLTAEFQLIMNEIMSYNLSVGPLIKQVLSMSSDNKLDVGLESMISSIIHMHINRMFRTQQRKYELLIYHFLLKFQKSRMARLRVDKRIELMDR